VSVADGDTISVLHDGAAVKIRLNAVDCPERSQAYGSAAKRFTSDLVFGQTVTVRPIDRDRYGRTVAHVLTGDGRDLGEALVSAGLAWWYQQYAPNDGHLKALENEARRAGRGLWADRSPVAPWEFRREERAERKGATRR
jgi:micrococcal nuclease